MTRECYGWRLDEEMMLKDMEFVKSRVFVRDMVFLENIKTGQRIGFYSSTGVNSTLPGKWLPFVSCTPDLGHLRLRKAHEVDDLGKSDFPKSWLNGKDPKNLWKARCVTKDMYAISKWLETLDIQPKVLTHNPFLINALLATARAKKGDELLRLCKYSPTEYREKDFEMNRGSLEACKRLYAKAGIGEIPHPPPTGSGSLLGKLFSGIKRGS